MSVLRPSVHMLPGIGWCGAGLPPFPTACWWLTHCATITDVSVAARWDSPGGCGGPSVLLLCNRLEYLCLLHGHDSTRGKLGVLPLSHAPEVWEFVCLLVGCLTSHQHASVSQGCICSDNFTCCHTEIEVADQTFYLTQYTDTGLTSLSADPITPGA